jgi:hypothetical protein
VLERVEADYGTARRQALQQGIAHYRQQRDQSAQIQRLLAIADVCMTPRSLPKNSKADFAQWYNQRHDPYGYSGPSDSRASHWKVERHSPLRHASRPAPCIPTCPFCHALSLLPCMHPDLSLLPCISISAGSAKISPVIQEVFFQCSRITPAVSRTQRE